MMQEEGLKGPGNVFLLMNGPQTDTDEAHIQIKKNQNQIVLETSEFYGRTVLIKLRDGLAKIRISQIEYVSYNNHTLQFYLTDGRVIRSRVIQESFALVVEHTLNDDRLIKPHESYLVNMDHVASLNARAFIMHSGAEVPISKRVYTQTKRRFVEYVVGRYETDIL